MKIKVLLASMLLPAVVSAQTFTLENEAPANPENKPLPCHPVPSDRQVKWNETEFYAFFHYGMNTFTNMEWGYGDEDESKYAPLGKPNPEQWVTSVKAAGMKGGIAVVKHHDGFCLWPTATTTHNLTNGGGQYHNVNIAEEFAKASKKHEMKYGFYVSPWDRNSAYYGTDDYVTKVFIPQCEELAAYGSDQFEMWFDGANGGDGYYGGARTTRSVDASIYYDIPNLRAKVHRIAPDCVMWGVGDEARWIGNEQGYSANTCWAMGNSETGDINGWYWHPGESDAKATNSGWFWHSGEGIKSASRLFQMYLETVGRNATLILNCPPNNYGVLPTQTVNTLNELGVMLHERLAVPVYGMDESTAANDFAKTAQIVVSDERTGGNYGISNLTDGDRKTYWATNDNTIEASITLTWSTAPTVRYLVLQEPIELGQRIKDFKIEYTQNGSDWQEMAKDITTTVGYKRIIPLNGSTEDSYGNGYKVRAMRITILDSRACPLISNINVY